MDYADKVYQAVLDTGVNMAVVFRDKLPATFRGLRVIDGDKDDLRFLDPQRRSRWPQSQRQGKA